MAVELISSWEELSRLEEPWNALSGDMPLRSWDWLATWWKHYGHDAGAASTAANSRHGERQLHVLAVFGETDQHLSSDGRGPELIGIAPFYLDYTVVKGNVLRWLGSGEVCTDHLTLICRPQHAARVAEAVANELTTKCDNWDLIELSAVDTGDAAMSHLVACLEERECVVSRHSAESCWVIDLPPSWEEFLAANSKSHRHQLRRLERRVLETPRVLWHTVNSADEFENAWNVLVDLHQRRRRSLGEPGCFASRLFHDFHFDLAGRLLSRGQLRMSWLDLDGTPAAAEYLMAGGGTTYVYQGGIDPVRLEDEPGSLSKILFFKQAFSEGQRSMDFLRGDEPYKSHWRAEPKATYDCRIVPNRRFARLRGRLIEWSDAAIDWVKQAAPQASA